MIEKNQSERKIDEGIIFGGVSIFSKGVTEDMLIQRDMENIHKLVPNIDNEVIEKLISRLREVKEMEEKDLEKDVDESGLDDFPLFGLPKK